MNQIEKNSLLIVAGTALLMNKFNISNIPKLNQNEQNYEKKAY